MTENDLDAVVAIAAIGFPNHFESRACFANRLALYPSGCFVLATNPAPPLGYVISYPWIARDAPALNAIIEAIPLEAEVIYWHDLALHPIARAGGHARAIVARLATDAQAAGWPAIALVAVNDATAFWQRHGFQLDDAAELRQKLASYGPDARYMIRPLVAKIEQTQAATPP